MANYYDPYFGALGYDSQPEKSEYDGMPYVDGSAFHDDIAKRQILAGKSAAEQAALSLIHI